MIFYDLVPVKHEIKNVWFDEVRELWCPHAVPDERAKGEFRYFCGSKDLDVLYEVDIPRSSSFFGMYAMFTFRCRFCGQTFTKIVTTRYAEEIRKEILKARSRQNEAV
jgi:hypothetical protein